MALPLRPASFALLFALVATASSAQVVPRPPAKSAGGSRGGSSEIEVPVNVGIGPAAAFFFGPVMEDQLVHTALKIDLFAVINQELIRKNQRRIPAKYRKYAAGITELRIHRPGPLILLPDSLIISPRVAYSANFGGNTGIYGATWKPIGIGTYFGGQAARVNLSVGALLTYAFIHSDVLPTTHFLRPGLEARAELEVMLAKSFGVSVGWASAFYIPQELGGFGLAPLDQAIWHVGQAYFMFHFRFPYKTTI